jgi:hypothetical protein
LFGADDQFFILKYLFFRAFCHPAARTARRPLDAPWLVVTVLNNRSSEVRLKDHKKQISLKKSATEVQVHWSQQI